MGDLGFWGWALVVVGGMAALGAALIYGEIRNRRRTSTERAVTEMATHRLYDREEREV